MFADLLIGVAYASISVTVWALLRRIKVPFSLVILGFGVFIGACGCTHFMEVWTLWHPDYWIAALIKTITAIASLGTGIHLYRLRHPIIALAETAAVAAQRGMILEKQALDLTEINKVLQREVSERKTAESELKKSEEQLRLVNETLEKRVEERSSSLRESESIFRSLTDAMPQLVYMAKPNGDLYWYNQRWYNFTGTTPEEMKGWGWQRVLDPSKLPQVLEAWRKALETKEPFEQTLLLKSGSGQFRWFLTRVVPVKNEMGQVVRWIGTNTDVHDLREARETAERVMRLKSHFLDIAAHELRTPVTAFTLMLQLSQMQLENKGCPVDILTLKRLRVQADRLYRLVVDLLDVSRLERGILKLKLQLTDIVSLVSECIDAFRLLSSTRLFTFSKPNVPIEINIDPIRIYQVISNLLDNASKYTPENTPVEITLEATPSLVTVSVKDHGLGVPEDQQSELFQPFRRGLSDREVRTSGLGLGLFISKSIINLHGGAIRVVSKSGEGSTFTFSLPRKDRQK